jgi:hypothetical protein
MCMNAVHNPEGRFEYELEVFRKEADEAAQHFYSYLTMHAVAGENKPIRQLFNSEPLFWLTALRALQTSFFIVLGRIFSQESEHNLDRLLRVAEEYQRIFSRDELARRKRGIAGLDVEKCVLKAYVPTSDDFREFRRRVQARRRVYEGSEIARQIVTALLEQGIKVLYVTHMYELAHGLWLKGDPRSLFLRAERLPDGTRTFRMTEGEPLETSYGADLYRKIFQRNLKISTAEEARAG